VNSYVGTRIESKFLIAAFSAVVCLSACSKKPEPTDKPNMTEKPLRLDAVFQNTKSFCFGRFVIEVPTTASVVFGPANAPDRIERLVGQAENMPQWIAKSVAQVSESFPDDDLKGEGSLLRQVHDGGVPGQKIVFGVDDGASYYYKIESFTPVGKDLFVQKSRAAPKEDDITKKYGGSVREQVAILNNVARNLRARVADEAPTEPGICIDGAFISEAAHPSHEYVTLGIRFVEFPDVHLSISVNKSERKVEGTDLELGLKKAEANAKASGQGALYDQIKTLRKGARQIDGWAGYEVLARKPAYEKNSESHEFMFFSQGEPKNAYKPELDVQLHTGVSGNKAAGQAPGITDEEAVWLWDKLTSTIRVRQTVAPSDKLKDKSSALTPLGELAATGSACPQTGWWQCAEDSRPVKGGKRQFFKEGQAMPTAVLVGDASIWQKLKGEKPVHELATVWKLVEYEETKVTVAPPVDPALGVVAQIEETSAPEAEDAADAEVALQIKTGETPLPKPTKDTGHA
jgi:hypothetical protein